MKYNGSTFQKKYNGSEVTMWSTVTDAYVSHVSKTNIPLKLFAYLMLAIIFYGKLVKPFDLFSLYM
jgi:hypothetical protein